MILESIYETKSNHNKFLFQKSSASREWFNHPPPPHPLTIEQKLFNNRTELTVMRRKYISLSERTSFWISSP